MLISASQDEDKQNVNRRPRDSLVLITKQQLGSDMVWMLPRVERTGCETMKDVSGRLAKTTSFIWYCFRSDVFGIDKSVVLSKTSSRLVKFFEFWDFELIKFTGTIAYIFLKFISAVKFVETI